MMKDSKVSFIVSAFDRPDHLTCLLYSLKVQTRGDFECIVTDNAPLDMIAAHQASIVRTMDERFSYTRPLMRDSYESANWGAERARGEYLCFPSDDSYYGNRFLDLVFRRGGDADLIYFNCVWDGHPGKQEFEFMHLETELRMNKIDKSGFLLRRERFLGFPGPFGTSRAADGMLIEQVVRQPGLTSKKVGFTPWMHN